jgi:hypothetical protein
VTGGLDLVVALGLDDPPRGAVEADEAPDKVSGDVVDRAVIELAPARVEAVAQPDASSSTWRAWASWSRTDPSAVPPSETFDSSHAPSRSNS